MPNYFDWAMDDGIPTREIDFRDGTKGSDMVVDNTVTRVVQGKYGSGVATISGAAAKPLLPTKPALVQQPVSPAAPVKPSLPGEPVSPDPIKMTPEMARRYAEGKLTDEDKNYLQSEQAMRQGPQVLVNNLKSRLTPAPQAGTDLDSLPTPDPLSASARKQFNRVEERRGTQAANKFASRHIDARPIPSWANFNTINPRDTVGSVGSTEPGVEKLWGRAKDGKLIFSSGKRKYEVTGKNPGELATNYRRAISTAKRKGDDQTVADFARYQSYLFSDNG